MTTHASVQVVQTALARTGWMAAAIVTALIVPAPAAAQALGPFTWQLQPYCNVITLRAFPEGQAFRLEGTDDVCSTGLPVRIVGTATADAGGNVSLTIVTPGPSGLSTVTIGQLLPAVFRGPWTDSQGRTGTLVFGVIGPMFGASRPAPQVSGAEIADGAIGVVDVDLGQIQGRITGTCPNGEFIQSVGQNGAVTCGTSPGGGDITGVTAGSGLIGGGLIGDVALSVDASQFQARLTGSCPSGEFIQGVGQNGTVNCASAPAGSGGDITGVTAGTGLTGGGLIGDVALSVDPAQFQARLIGACPPGLFMITAGNAGAPACTDGAEPGAGTAAFGANALIGNSASQNSAFGENALRSNTAGGANSAFGANALFSNLTGVENTAVGQDAMLFNNGFGNSALGQAALYANTTGSNNTAVGQAAMGGNTTGNDNTAVGDDALRDNSTGGENTAVGQHALRFNNGSGNSALGKAALFANTTGIDNTAVGQAAMGGNSTGDGNTAIGDDALRDNVAGSSNTAVGALALNNSTGSTNIAVGSSAGVLLVTGSDNIYIGHAGPDGGTESAAIRMGTEGTHTATFVAGINGQASPNGVPVFVDGSGRLGTANSSRRYKNGIEPIAHAQFIVQALRPVEFTYKPAFDDGTRALQYGLIAEEVAEVSPELVVRDQQGQPQTVRYHFLTPLLLAEVQRLEGERRALAADVASLRATVESLVRATRAPGR